MNESMITIVNVFYHDDAVDYNYLILYIVYHILYTMHDVIGKFILKGVAFPVCISVNEFVCHCSPLETEEGVSD